jgi:hypothetical protein
MTEKLSNVLSPVAEGAKGGFAGFTMPEASTAERTGSLDNKTVYLIDNGFGGSCNFMKQLQEWFKEKMPSVKTVIKRKPGSPFMGNNPELWKEIKEKGNAAVIGVAG